MRRVVTLAPLVLLAACQGPPTAVTPPPPPPRPAADASAAPAVPSGLTPLPSSQQVVAAFPVGRRDPFASLAPAATAAQAGAGAKAAALKPPEFLNEFKISGVIQGAGHAEAVVTYKNVSGSLRQGDRGGRTTDLLPSGWSVAAVDVQNGFLVLQNGGRKVKVDL